MTGSPAEHACMGPTGCRSFFGDYLPHFPQKSECFHAVTAYIIIVRVCQTAQAAEERGEKEMPTTEERKDDSMINPPRNREAGFPRVGRDVADPAAMISLRIR